jgi:hypothetical protein
MERRLRILAGHVTAIDPELAHPRYTYVERFEAGSLEANAFLEANGFLVIKSVLSPHECSEGLSLAWDFLEGLGSGIRRDDVRTWTDEHWYPEGTQAIPFYLSLVHLPLVLKTPGGGQASSRASVLASLR